jgi:hypothetical protein
MFLWEEATAVRTPLARFFAGAIRSTPEACVPLSPDYYPNSLVVVSVTLSGSANGDISAVAMLPVFAVSGNA